MCVWCVCVGGGLCVWVIVCVCVCGVWCVRVYGCGVCVCVCAATVAQFTEWNVPTNDLFISADTLALYSM